MEKRRAYDRSELVVKTKNRFTQRPIRMTLTRRIDRFRGSRCVFSVVVAGLQSTARLNQQACDSKGPDDHSQKNTIHHFTSNSNQILNRRRRVSYP